MRPWIFKVLMSVLRQNRLMETSASYSERFKPSVQRLLWSGLSYSANACFTLTQKKTKFTI